MLMAALREFFIHRSPLNGIRGRPITMATFACPKELRTHPKIRQEAISLAWRFAAISGLDQAGADSISILYTNQFFVTSQNN